MATEKAHRWGNPDENRAKACNNEGCPVRAATTGITRKAVWQRKRGAHWRLEQSEPIPRCAGKESAP